MRRGEEPGEVILTRRSARRQGVARLARERTQGSEDQRARIEAVDPGFQLAKLDLFGMLAEDARVDDIVLATGRMRRSYALGDLGTQSGADGGESAAVADPWSRWYHHFSDLATVVAATDADGAMIGAYVPDFHGNYRTVAGERPDSMGLTSKFYDEDAGLYYFGARWLDPVRGRWMSEEPMGWDGPNLYQFVFGDGVNWVDITGLSSWRPPLLFPRVSDPDSLMCRLVPESCSDNNDFCGPMPPGVPRPTMIPPPPPSPSPSPEPTQPLRPPTDVPFDPVAATDILNPFVNRDEELREVEPNGNPK